jgi:hypothetical protein
VRWWIPLVASLLASCTLDFDATLLPQDAGADAGHDAAFDAGPGTDGGVDGGADGGADGGRPDGCSVALSEGRDETPEPDAGPAPEPGELVRDPTFGSCIVRSTDVANAEAPADSVRVRRLPAYNADGTRLLGLRGSYRWWVYDANSYEPATRLPAFAGDEPHWDPDDPETLRYLRSDRDGFVMAELRVGEFTPRSEWDYRAAVEAVFADAAQMRVPSRTWEGAASADTRYWVLQALDASESPLGLVVLDRESETIAWSLETAGGTPPVDGAALSRSGAHVIVFRCAPGHDANETVLYVPPGDTATRLADGCPSVWDTAVLGNGHDAFVYRQDAQIVAVDLETEERRVLTRELWLAPGGEDRIDVRISGAAHDRPGWVVLSFFGCLVGYGGATECEPGRSWMQDKIVAMELLDESEDPRIYNLAWHRGVVDSSSAFPIAVPSPALTRVLFVSNWGGGPPDIYQILLPDGLPP